MTDVLIIGGGIAGLSAAAALAPHGKVLLLEAEDALAYHASGRSAAIFLENYGNHPVVALNRASMPVLRGALNVLSPRGLILVGADHQEQAFAATCADLRMHRITASEACAQIPILNPDRVHLAAYARDVFDLDTHAMIEHYRKRARAHGARIQTGARVMQITYHSGWQVMAGDTEYSAPTLINAAGAWADQIAELAGLPPIGLTPKRRSIAQVPLPEGLDPASWPAFEGAGESWYAKPDAGRLNVSPGDADPVAPQDAWVDDMVLAQGLARYEAFVSTRVTRVTHSWAGLRTFAPDQSLVLGPDPLQPDFFWCAGQGGYGFQTAPAASALLAALATWAQPELDPAVLPALTPDRFHLRS